MAIAKGTVVISYNNAHRIVTDLTALLSSKAVVFDIETTGLNSQWHEIVSFAAKLPDAAYHMSTFIMPKRPKDLLKKDESGQSAYDINGIHPDDLLGSPTFEEAYPEIRQALQGKHWVCWNADFDANFLDVVCDKRGVERIPRAGVSCAMKLLSPLAGLRGQRRGRIERVVVNEDADDRYRKQKLSRLAKRMGIDTRNAHDAAADVDMTIQVMRWAYDNVKSLPAPRKQATTTSRKAKPVFYKEKEIEDFGMTISESERQQILNEAIIQHQATGARLESRVGFQAVFVTQEKTNHILHLIVTLITGGLWLPVWVLLALTRKKKREALQVDEYGEASLESAKR
ncbi:MAG: 3'-5' exonuclease [Chloroflexi bacterium]|nr:3'-5' exonuclease [Chloroflexota bacterium]